MVVSWRDENPAMDFDPFEDLIATRHVLCPDCHVETYGPYHDPHHNTYFDGHYCEGCGLTWRWNEDKQEFVGRHG